MARVEIILETDGGGSIAVVETSAFPVTGGVAAAGLVQAGYVKIMGALGLTTAAHEEEQGDTAPAEPDTKGLK